MIQPSERNQSKEMSALHQLALKLVAVNHPESELKGTCALYNSYSYVGSMKVSIYNLSTPESVRRFHNISSWIVPEARGIRFSVLLLNHTTREMLITTPIDVALCLMNLSRADDQTEGRFSLDDSYEVRPTSQGVRVEERDYGVLNGSTAIVSF